MRAHIAIICLSIPLVWGVWGCGRDVAPPKTVVYAAKEETAEPDAVRELNKELARMAAETPHETPPPLGPPVREEQPAPEEPPKEPEPPKTIEELGAEVTALRTEIRRLQDSVNETLDLLVADLHDENQRLRAEVERLSSAAPEKARIERGAIPMPGGDVVAEVEKQAAATPDAPLEPAPEGPPKVEVLKEWGRTAEEAKELGPNVSSLKGMILAAPAQLTDEQLAELGRNLYNEYAAYEAVVIDVFDDVEAARDYAERNIKSGEHHVLRIAKHRSTNDDPILLTRGGKNLPVSQ
ncbi:MAG: hypothetical protein K1Y02_15590 [Candidatus Hydrogenedentes bacterium]|nr:hypothetical protein [Candidatus Hydrogenedentota bacterium]